jgi:hypothetical protein
LGTRILQPPAPREAYEPRRKTPKAKPEGFCPRSKQSGLRCRQFGPKTAVFAPKTAVFTLKITVFTLEAENRGRRGAPPLPAILDPQNFLTAESKKSKKFLFVPKGFNTLFPFLLLLF